MQRVTLSIFLALCLIANAAKAGSLGYQSISGYMSWEPDCYRPVEPSFYVYDIDSYNYAVAEYNSYLHEVQAFIHCIEDEAELDIELTRRAIINGFDEQRSTILSELESAKNSLDYSRILID